MYPKREPFRVDTVTTTSEVQRGESVQRHETERVALADGWLVTTTHTTTQWTTVSTTETTYEWFHVDEVHEPPAFSNAGPAFNPANPCPERHDSLSDEDPGVLEEW